MLFVIRQMLVFLRPCRGVAVVFLFVFAIENIVISLAPLSFQFMIDYAIIPQDRGAFSLILIILSTAGLVGVCAGLASDRLLAHISAVVQRNLRARLFTGMQRLDLERYGANRTGEHVARFTVDLPAIESAMAMLMTIGLQSLIVVAFSTAVLFTLQWSMALVILAGACLIYMGPFLLGKRATTAFTAYRNDVDRMAGDVQENARGQLVIQGFSLQNEAIRRFTLGLQQLFRSHYRKNVMGASLDRLPMISLLLVNFTMIGFGSYLALTERITLGAMVAFFTIYTSMGNAVYNLTAVAPSFTGAKVSLDRILELLNQPPAKESEQIKIPQLSHCPEIAADKLIFGYPGQEPLLQGVSFTIEAGSSVAFVGPSGSGKSTLLHLIMGLRQPNGGRITIDGEDLSSLNAEAYRKCIGAVFQDSFLFRASVLDNIRIAKPEATLQDVMEAAEQADIHEFIASLPNGYDTLVSEDGGNLSGGQKQRIAIARALVRQPSLLLLDEVTSALDPISEAAVNATIQKLSGSRTVVIVTHRLEAITGVDQIFVMNEGRLMESGRHSELMNKGGLYKFMREQQTAVK
ncbi:ATP-binding cassette subfamily B protein [Fontibacillus solani]|uniref:ATP-binding cassette subfamily B protein n=1 Tax=Fontibacillus solani TaxID=1572857 RepID=A0A7W3XSJ9_9BACL|nr:ABC transporter ATP-binding protein [Fontibacillus solani]MBA9086631.1 ATP-binding cassette subfamily B protein [Fontibacillus solani]